jgi:hypothetical protein
LFVLAGVSSLIDDTPARRRERRRGRSQFSERPLLV